MFAAVMQDPDSLVHAAGAPTVLFISFCHAGLLGSSLQGANAWHAAAVS